METFVISDLTTLKPLFDFQEWCAARKLEGHRWVGLKITALSGDLSAMPVWKWALDAVFDANIGVAATLEGRVSVLATLIWLRGDGRAVDKDLSVWVDIWHASDRMGRRETEMVIEALAKPMCLTDTQAGDISRDARAAMMLVRPSQWTAEELSLLYAAKIL